MCTPLQRPALCALHTSKQGDLLTLYTTRHDETICHGQTCNAKMVPRPAPCLPTWYVPRRVEGGGWGLGVVGWGWGVGVFPCSSSFLGAKEDRSCTFRAWCTGPNFGKPLGVVPTPARYPGEAGDTQVDATEVLFPSGGARAPKDFYTGAAVTVQP